MSEQESEQDNKNSVPSDIDSDGDPKGVHHSGANSTGVKQSDFYTSSATPFADQAPQIESNKPSIWIWIGLAGLTIVALLVIFVLPAVVSEYELPLERRVEITSPQSNQAAATAITTISPFEEAQRSLQRKEAQDVLADLLTIQGELTDLEVENWGQVAYEAALEQASIGDDYYRKQDFLLARDSYGEGRDRLARLMDSIPSVLIQTLIDAQKALEASDSSTAANKFNLALLLDLSSEEASIGLERSRSLDEVRELIVSADDLLDAGELEQARATYQEILDLDSYNEFARGKVQEVSALILEREFSQIMSSGYASLEDGDPDEAIATFERAMALGINREQALAAITQTENEVANAEINRLQKLIVAAETQERWQSAVDDYVNVLAIDSNLLFAINGSDYAGKRARLDSLLVDAIGNPERFAEDAVFEQVRDIYFTGRAIEDSGPRLISQLGELQLLLENSQVTIDIQLSSDNLTDVTLLRLGGLGKFEQTTLALKPGRYVAIGKRIGYREVRTEFVVGFGQTPTSVSVKCEERIAASGRR